MTELTRTNRIFFSGTDSRLFITYDNHSYEYTCKLQAVRGFDMIIGDNKDIVFTRSYVLPNIDTDSSDYKAHHVTVISHDQNDHVEIT